MKLDKRCIVVLDLLLQQEDFIKIKSLAKEVQTTERNIRYSLTKIDRFLNAEKVNPLIRHPRKGVMVENRPRVRTLFAQFNQRITPETYKYASEEIEQFIFLKLLLMETPISIQYFEETLFISRTSVINHLRALEGEVFLSDLTLTHKPRIGYLIEGDLMTKSVLFARRFLSAVNIREFYQFLDSEQSLSKKGELFFYNLFELDLLAEVVAEGEAITQDLNRTVDDQLYLTILSILLKCHHNDTTFKFQAWENQGTPLDAALEKIIGLVKQFKNAGQVALVKHFAGRLCIKMGDIYHQDFLTDNQAFFEQISAHISLMIKRLRAGVSIANPIFSEFMRENKEIFITTKRICAELEEEFQFSISAQEISFLAIYFASELERKQVSHTKPSLLIVCAAGMAVSNMLRVQLDQLFEFSEIDTTSLHKFDPAMMKAYDYVITTVDIPDVHSKRLLRIHPYLQKEDMKLLQEHFQMKLVKNDEQMIDKFSEIMKIISENAQITNLSKLELDLLECLTKNQQTRNHDLPAVAFDESSVIQVKDMPTWRKAIRIGTSHLENQGYVTEQFYEKIIHNFKEFGPYMVVSPGVVLAHAGPEDGVIRDSMSVTILEEGVLFYDRYEEPVRLIFTLAFKSPETRKLVEQLVKFVLNEEKVNRLVMMKSARDIYHDVQSAIYE
ncbi:BglG family transcription antiterminator [Listeria ilorinensis]|uniref:BglG family transcription antiterminator n=1 Tax=Listeria ilorinensis TaxID=2867439 RepID=UPI001EF54498|nr:BglG family transcription antiterminator [Listeria ilorinensis]